MSLTRSQVEDAAAAYVESEPFYTVEAEEIDGLGPALASGEFGWRDAEWVVQWYYRRRLGDVPNRARREREAAYDENGYEAVRDALATAAGADDAVAAVDALTQLSGVDVGVASAFLMFLDPDAYLVVSDREWAVLVDSGELDEPFPEPLTTADYRTYLGTARAVADRLDCSLWTLYRALWRIGAEA